MNPGLLTPWSPVSLTQSLGTQCILAIITNIIYDYIYIFIIIIIIVNMHCTCTRKSLHTSKKTVTIFFAWSFLSSAASHWAQGAQW